MTYTTLPAHRRSPSRAGAVMSTTSSEHVASAREEVTLRSGAIGLPGAIAGTLSNMAPVEGIFIVLVLVAAGMGTLTPWAFMVGALGILLTAWNVGQLGKRVPSAGSFVGFAFHGAGAVRRSWAR